MKVKVLTLPFDDSAGGFDTSELEELSAHYQLTDVRHEFFFHNSAPWVMILVAYRGEPSIRVRAPKRRAKEALSENLTPEEKLRYDRLRDWRRLRAAQDGVNLFVIGTNNQLAKIVLANPKTLGDLSRVQGMGAKRMGRYAEDILRVLHLESGDISLAEGSDPDKASVDGPAAASKPTAASEEHDG